MLYPTSAPLEQKRAGHDVLPFVYPVGEMQASKNLCVLVYGHEQMCV